DLLPSGLASGYEMHNSYPQDDDRGGVWSVQDTKTIGSAYDLYLQSAVTSYILSHACFSFLVYGGTELGRAVGGGRPGLPTADSAVIGRARLVGHDVVSNGRDVGFGGHFSVDAMTGPARETVPLPPDASSTLYVEGLPPDSSRREVAHIFRPFVGYKEVRLVTKESRHRGGDPLVLCFVDFVSPACAATAMSALQGYNMDEHGVDSNYLRLQFSRYPGPRSGSSQSCGRR
ncbi:RRM_1 domain-containing protein, partial [Cephalotus follicularis]